MTMHTEKEVVGLLRSTEAILDGHFLLSSGKHAGRYIQCAKLLQHPEPAQVVCAMLAKRALPLGKIDLVVGPALGGIVIAYELARALDVRGIFTEREAGEMTLRRGFRIEPGEKVLVAEDVVTTGRSALEAAQVVRKSGGEVVGVACIVDRRMHREEVISLPVISAVRLEIAIYDPKDCPLCRRGDPCIKPGSRTETDPP